MKEGQTVWIVDPDSAFCRAVKEILRPTAGRVVGRKRTAPTPAWKENDTLIIAADLLPVQNTPRTVIALVPQGDTAASVRAGENGAHWCLPRDPALLPDLPAILPISTLLCADEESLSAPFEQLPQEIAVVFEDPEGRLTLVSPGAARMLGGTPQELLGHSLKEFLSPIHAEQPAMGDARRSRGVPTRYEGRILHRDGSTTPVQVLETPRFEEGRFSGAAVFLSSVSPENRLRRQSLALQQIAAIGEARDLPEIFRQAEAALQVLIEGACGTFVFVTDETGEGLRLLVLDPSHPVIRSFSTFLGKAPSEIYFPMSIVPVEWRERIPKGLPCVSLDIVGLAREMIGAEIAQSILASGLQGLAVLPLRSGGLLRGLIGILLERPPTYEEDLNLAMAVANLVASAMENRLLLEQARQRVEGLNRLVELTQTMATSTEPRELATVAARQFIHALGLEEAVISLWDRETDTLQTVVDFRYDYERGVSSQEDIGIYARKDLPIISEVIEKRQPLQILASDVGEKTLERAYMDERGIQTLVILPLVHKGECIGVIELRDSQQRRKITPDQMNLAITLSGQVTAVLENARLLSETQRRAIQLQTAAEVAQHATAILDVETLLTQSVELIRQRFDLYYVGIFLVEERGRWVVLRAGTGEAGCQMLREGHRLQAGGPSMIGWCVANRQARIALDVGKEAIRFQNPLLPQTRSEIALPMISRGRVIGAMTIQSARPAAFSQEDITTFRTLADQLANAVENARLHEEQRRRLGELTALYEIGHAVTAVLDLKDLIEIVYQQIDRFINAPIFYIALWDQERGTIRLPVIIEAGQRIYNQETGWEGLAGWVLRHGQPLLISDVSDEENLPPNTKPIIVGQIRSSSLVLVPLTIGERVIGALSIQSEQRNAYNRDDVRFLTAVATQVAVAIENARLYTQERRRAEELAALNAVAARLGQSLELKDVLDMAMEEVTRVLGVEASAISLADEETQQLVLYAQRGLRYLLIGKRIPFGEGLSGSVLRSGEVLTTGDLSRDPRLAIPEFGQEQIQAMALVPMHFRGRVVGVLSAMSHLSREFTEREISLLQAIANQVGAAVESARLFEAERSQRQTAETLRSVAAILTSSLEIEQVLDWLLDHLERLVPHDQAMVMLLEDGQLRVAAAHGQASIPTGADVASGAVMLAEAPLLRQVIQAKEVMLIADVHTDPRWESGERPPVASWVAVPLTVRDTAIGLLSAARKAPPAFTDGEANLVADIASHAAIAIENARLYDAARRQAGELAVMYHLATTVSRSLELSAVLSEALAHVTELSGLRTGAIFLREGSSHWMTLAAHRRLPSGAPERLSTISLGQGPLGKAVQRSEATRLPLWEIFSGHEYSQEQTPSGVVVPLWTHGKVIGAMALAAPQVQEIPPATVRLLETVARHLAVAIENARLYAEMEIREQMARGLYQITRGLTSLEPSQIPERVLAELHRVIPYEVAGLLICWDSGTDLMLHVTSPCSQEELQQVEVRMLDGFRLLGGEPPDRTAVNRSIWTHTKVTATPAPRTPLDTHLNAPLVVGERLAGLIQLSSRRPNAYDEQAQRVLLTLANQVATAVENAQLYQAVKEHAANLERAYARLREVDQLKDELIQNVSHELRTPLTFVKGYVQLLLNGELGPLTEAQRKSLDVVDRKTDHLARLVSDMVTLETVRRETLDVKPTNLAQLARMALEGCRLEATKAGIELQEEIPEGLPLVLADWSRISEVFDNLLANAIKFSPGGGTIVVRAVEEGNWVRVEVSDTGIGIPAEKLPRIFDRFYQVDGSARRRFGGAGLGLAIVKRIVEAHGGRVGARSKVGEGSTFYFTLPRANL